ncbi:CDP-alcohol phosphatidyltransferase family protein [Marivita sp. S0852]|uniref:CDP-alcohol phosphatidyltransferase family protein n=1 Tax=Marivita sp. S0852 TaxID=3373893 RepID=UPI0039823AB2
MASDSGIRAQFAVLSLIGLFGFCAMVWSLTGETSPKAMALGGVIYGIVSVIAGKALTRSYPYNRVGWCNAVTVFRLMLTAALISWLWATPISVWVVFLVALLALALDGLDGWLARHEGYVSAFGARFDMEVDSLLALVLAMHAYLTGTAGLYVLLLGVPRYVFFALHIPMPWLAGDLPPRFSRKLVCVLQISVLILAVFPPASPLFVTPAVIFTILAVMWSFWIDVRYLRRTFA